jgi:hypothetical protein
VATGERSVVLVASDAKLIKGVAIHTSVDGREFQLIEMDFPAVLLHACRIRADDGDTTKACKSSTFEGFKK